VSLDRVEQAKRNAMTARARLDGTLVAVQQRLRPGNLAGEAWDGVKDKSADLADGALTAVRKRPAATAVALGAFAAFLAREPIKRAVSRMFGDDGRCVRDGRSEVMVAKSDGPEAGGRTRGSGGRAADAYQTARERTVSAYEAARDRAADVTRQASEQISVYPVGAVIGGLALGALVGFLLPASRRERDLLSPTGKKITEAARSAAQRGIDAGKEQIDEIRSRAAKKVGEAVVEAVGGGKS
jgi:ElaB/YqjD/DUF883 family membrane-anchored ribosome-binding protein